MGGKESLLLTPRGNRYILTIIDMFTKFVVAVPLLDQTSETITAMFLRKWILVFGPPGRVHTDQGLCFESAHFNSLLLVWRIAKTRTTAYHPQGNGVCERVNQTIKQCLRRLQNEQNLSSWDLYLPLAVFAYNTVIYCSTKFTPFFLHLVRKPVSLLI